MANRTAADIEREIDETRAHADHVLRDIEQRLTPERMIQDATTFFRDSPTGQEMVRNLRASVISNPIPLMLTAVGIGWMMLDGLQARRARHTVERVQARRRVATDGRRDRDSHHVHVEDGGSGRAHVPEDLVGQRHAGKSARDSAEAFESGNGETEWDPDRTVPTVLGPDGQPIANDRRPTP